MDWTPEARTRTTLSMLRIQHGLGGQLLGVLIVCILTPTSAYAAPTINTIVDPVELRNGVASSLIWVEDIVSAAGVARVYADVTPPDAGESVTVDLDDVSGGRFEAWVFHFEDPGVYTVSVFVEDEDGVTSPAAVTTVTQTVRVDLAGPDPFEPNDTPDTASLIVVGDVAQRHNFHVDGDVDYLQLFVAEPIEEFYSFRVTPVDATGELPAADVRVQVLGADGTTVLDEIDQDFEGEAEEFEFRPTSAGVYYLRIDNYTGESGANTYYDVTVFVPVAPVPGPDVVLEQSVFKTILPLGAGVSLELLITNRGANAELQTATNVNVWAVIDTLTVNGELPVGCEPDGTAVKCVIGDLPENESRSITLPLKLSAGGRPYVISNVASFDDDGLRVRDENPGNNTRQTRFFVESDLDTDGDGLPDSY